ncbi:MAG: hypothetical protein JXX14_17710 [Deltaproteobacteria bacterium]|nr:hypothetical protein [Deltaproteobacteria bacterium]
MTNLKWQHRKKKPRHLSGWFVCALTGTFGILFWGCADAPEEYTTVHNPEYAITYLLTDFESGNHRNAEGVDRNSPPYGYHYTFGDPNAGDDYIEPFPKESELCRTQTLEEFYSTLDSDELLDAIRKGDTDAELRPYPPKCSVITGLQTHPSKPFSLFDSRVSFHMRGVTAGEGVGFGTYFSDYIFYENTDPQHDRMTLRRNENGDLPAPFSEGRQNALGQSVCRDDALWAGKIDPRFYNSDRRPFMNLNKADTAGLYPVEGSVYTAGHIWVDSDGKEHYALKHPYPDKMKEPRCLLDMGQKGFVMWAMGNTAIEVALNVPETAPMSDGGLCDADAGEKCYDFHRMRFELDGAWREYHASFDEFVQDGWGKPVPLNPNHIINIQIKVPPPTSGEKKTFDIWLDHIGFYGGETWEFVDRLADTEWIVVDTETALVE